MSGTDSEWIWSEEHRDYFRYQWREDGNWHQIWGRSTIPPPRTQSESAPSTSAPTTTRPSQAVSQYPYATSSSQPTRNDHPGSAHSTDPYGQYASPSPAGQVGYSYPSAQGQYNQQPGRSNPQGSRDSHRDSHRDNHMNPQTAPGYQGGYAPQPHTQAPSDPSRPAPGYHIAPRASNPVDAAVTQAANPATAQPCYYCHSVTHTTQEHYNNPSLYSPPQ